MALSPRMCGLAVLLPLLSSFPALAQVRDITVEPARITYKGRPLYEKSWAVLIGINRYQHARVPPLEFAVNDVRNMKRALLQLGFQGNQILELTEHQATKRGIESLLGDRLRRLVGREDRVLIFFAGHGKDEEVREGKDEGYLIPYDADPEQLYSTAISMSALLQIAERLRAKHVLFTVDACYSGFAAFKGRSIVNPELIEDLTRRPAVQVITAGRKGELAQEKEGQGLFTGVLIKGLEGQADRRGWGWLSLDMLGEYVRDRVYAESGRRQYPQFGNLSGEGQFVFVLPSEGRLPLVVPPSPRVEPPARDPAQELLAKADGLIARQALTTPPGANAYEMLQEILRVNPAHEGALERLRKIAETYKTWARKALERGQTDVARRYLEAAKRILPEDREVAELEDRIAKLGEEARREAERRRLEEERRKSEEVARAEAERRRLEEERRRLEEERRLGEERARVEAERRRVEEERQRLAALQKEREERERRERERVAVAPPAMPHERSFPPDNRPMVLVPAGKFIMGSTQEDIENILRACPNCKRDWFLGELPQRRVYLDAFYIDKHPITNDDFERFVRTTGHRTEAEVGDGGFVWTGSKWEKRAGATWRSPEGAGSSIQGRAPVVQISWNDARSYCRWAGKRLPTEAEWEKAARGPDGRKYPWGNEWDPGKAIFSGNSGGKPHPVDRTYNTHRSPYGAVDMAGNVWQWVADWYDEDYYARGENRNPKGPASGSDRVLRGGSWFLYPGNLRAPDRYRLSPSVRDNSIGARCAQAP